MVRREVARIALASLGRLARMDRELIRFWEGEQLLSSAQSSERLTLVEREVAELEALLRAAPSEDRYHIAVQLRELYWKLLHHARQHWASSEGYQTIRARVIAGLQRIESMGTENAA